MDPTAEYNPNLSQPQRRAIPVLFQAHARLTWVLLGVIVLIFLVEEALGGSEIGPVLTRLGANLPAEHPAASPWRLLSSIFLHIGWMHLFANGMVLVFLGRFFEKLVGSQRFFLLFLFSGIAGSWASSIFSGADLSAGASGGLWGLLGACLALSLFPGPVFPPPWVKSFRKNTIINLGINLYFSTLANIDFAAHLGGGLMGLLLFASGFLTRGLPVQPHHTVPRLLKMSLSRIFFLSVLTTVLAIAIPWIQKRPQELWAPNFSKTQKLALDNADQKNPFHLVFKSPDFLGLKTTSGSLTTAKRFVLGDIKTDPVMLILSWRPIAETLNNQEEQQQAAREVLQAQKKIALPGEVKVQTDFSWLDGFLYPSWHRILTWENGIVQHEYAQMQNNALLEIQVLYYQNYQDHYETFGHTVFETLRIQPFVEQP